MAVPVNPVGQLRRPNNIPHEWRHYLEGLEKIILQLKQRTGGDTDLIDQAATNFNISLVSDIFDIRQQIGSGINTSIDTTGFTVDTTLQTTDQTEQ